MLNTVNSLPAKHQQLVFLLKSIVTVAANLEIAAPRLLIWLSYHGSTLPNEEARDNLPSS